MGVGISMSGLASAVANEGGIGVISAAGLGLVYKEHSKDFDKATLWGLKEVIRKAREAAHRGIIGVNIMVAMRPNHLGAGAYRDLESGVPQGSRGNRIGKTRPRKGAEERTEKRRFDLRFFFTRKKAKNSVENLVFRVSFFTTFVKS